MRFAMQSRCPTAVNVRLGRAMLENSVPMFVARTKGCAVCANG
jgi:hypothetical protein